MDVSQWMLTCSSCGNDFLQSSIPENLRFVELHLPPKPEFPPGGLTRDCPHCGKSATYERHDLRYRGTGPTDYPFLSSTLAWRRDPPSPSIQFRGRAPN